MNFDLQALNLKTLAKEKAEALVLLVPTTFAASSTDAISQLLADVQVQGDLDPKKNPLISVYRPVGIAAGKVYVLPVNDASLKAARAGLQTVLSTLKTTCSHTVVACLEAVDEDFVRQTVALFADALYQYTASRSKTEPVRLQKIGLRAPNAKALQNALALAQATVTGQALAKEWGNRPGNYATPTLLAKAAQDLAKRANLTCEVLGPKEVAKLGMGSFMGVAQGSDEPLRFIVLRYDGAAKSKAPVVLVGKGITFDSGGISIKPAAEMDEMKFDMCGAASVLGTFEALGQLRPKINVVGLIPACENLPSSKSIKPGDVLTSMDGQTIEVLNTDAEGRLILCDALTYAKRFKPQAIVDIATLTGACVIALGSVRSGLFSNNDGLALALQNAGEKSADLCWRMPLDDEYSEGLKSNFADVANVAGRAAGSVTAAKFLQRFVGDTPWAHLDIAGTAWKGGAAKGATGRPVPLLLQYLLSQAEVR
ncbi:leucyl aminopeptidase [Curvibacter sp. CHRR-16]|uniref:leucyl aminopeptidase n=1 Tax=Curvibacter sp. CHRR-16 TaxID=2835872 RepID=UPI001BDB29D1|nr:leucyl aminopeptidase [Curvibacter sp. CHRR-16]MBT0571229.1 leucyl aminopeptidase [Curvibacter sp. CHRR-16]